MKKPLLKSVSAFLAFWILSVGVLSAASSNENTNTKSYSNLFDVEDEFNDEFAELDMLESEIMENGLGDYNSLVNANPNLLSDIGLNEIKSINSINGTQGFSLDQMDWGAFAWGLLCCPVGFFVVAINKDKGQDQKTSFWVGWAVSTVLGVVNYAVFGVRVN